ncbi:MAG TPA: autotransporter-associated beta strand repeat-containing protein, partial [Isosphaeraceae bacterium]|nr:autotransporter-associated beta strand repeat-containing protein [Isosphaeraceae bacterium]
SASAAQAFPNGSALPVIEVTTADLDITGQIIPNGAPINSNVAASVGFAKTGLGRLVLSGNNTYPGITDVREGTLAALNSQALGPANSFGTQVDDGATLELPTGFTLNEELFLAGTGVDHVGALHVLAGTASPKGRPSLEDLRPIHLLGPASIGVDAPSVLVVPGPIERAGRNIFQQKLGPAGSAALIKVGTGVLFAGSPLPASPISILAGSIVTTANDSDSTDDIVVQAGAYYAPEQGAIVSRHVVLQDNANLFVFGKAVLTGGVAPEQRANIIVNPDQNGVGELELLRPALGGFNLATLTKSGAGLLSFRGNDPAFGLVSSVDATHPFSSDFLGTIDLKQGAALLSEFALDQALFVVEGGTTFSASDGRNDVGGLDAQARSQVVIGKGAQVDSKGDLTIEAGSRLTLVFTPTLPGPFLTAEGAVRLAGSLSALGVPGNMPSGPVTLIHKLSPGAVVGAFQGLPEGALLNVGNAIYRITYRGGAGNDVVLNPTNIKPHIGAASQPLVAGAVNPGSVSHSSQRSGATAASPVKAMALSVGVHPRGPVRTRVAQIKPTTVW